MALGIYKPGQGYWMRVLTAIGIGIMVLSGAVWGWRQAQAVRLPAKNWTMATSAGQGDLPAGSTVSILRFDTKTASSEPVVFGTARVADYRPASAGRGEIVLDTFDSPTTRDEASDAVRVQAGDLDRPTFRATVASAVSEPVFPQLYLQAGISGGVILLGTIIIAWFVGSNPSSSDFLIATDSEMKKVNWSTYKQIKGSTIVVIVAAFLIAGILFFIDIGFSQLFRAIGVLET